MRTATLALAAFASALLAPPLLAAPQPPTEQEARAALKTMPADTVVLVDAGEGEARALRYSPEEGADFTYEARQKLTMEAVRGEDAVSYIDYPASVCNVDGRVTKINDDGSFVLESTFTVLNAEPATSDDEEARLLRDTIDSSLSRLAGTRVTQTVSATGLELEHAIEAPGPANIVTAQQVALLVREALVPFPDEPIAPGATWRLRRDVKANGSEETHLLTYRLAALDDGVATVELAVRYVIDEQGTQQGFTINSGSGGAVGTLRVRLALAAPAEYAIRSDTNLTATTDPPNRRITLDQRVTSESSVTLLFPTDDATTTDKQPNDEDAK